MTWAASIIVMVCATYFVALLWILVCNNRTYEQRLRLIKWAAAEEYSSWHRLWLYEAVSYDQHLWALFFFRSPWDLYGAEVSLLRRAGGLR